VPTPVPRSPQPVSRAVEELCKIAGIADATLYMGMSIEAARSKIINMRAAEDARMRMAASSRCSTGLLVLMSQMRAGLPRYVPIPDFGNLSMIGTEHIARKLVTSRGTA
jgi:hypothetical protein